MNNFISVILGGKFQREKDQPLKESYGDYDWNTTSSVFSRAKRLTESLYNPPEQLLRRDNLCPFWSVGLRGRLTLKWELPHHSIAINFKFKRKLISLWQILENEKFILKCKLWSPVWCFLNRLTLKSYSHFDCHIVSGLIILLLPGVEG